MRNGNTSTMEKARDLFGNCINQSKKLNQLFKMVLFIEVNRSSSTPYIPINCPSPVKY